MSVGIGCAALTVMASVGLCGFAPMFTLRLILMVYPPGDERPDELIAEMRNLRRRDQAFWVGQQVATALFDGLPARRAHMKRQRADRQLAEFLDDRRFWLEGTIKRNGSHPVLIARSADGSRRTVTVKNGVTDAMIINFIKSLSSLENAVVRRSRGGQYHITFSERDLDQLSKKPDTPPAA